MKIKVLDHEIDVKYIKSSGFVDENQMGLCTIQSGSIKIKDSMTKDVKSATFFHELVHFISITNGYDGLAEQFVDAMGLGLHSFFKNNKKFLASL